MTTDLYRQGDIVQVINGPSTGMRGYIRLIDGNEALVIGENSEGVVLLEHCYKVSSVKMVKP